MMVILPAVLLAAEFVAELAVGDKFPVFYMVLMIWAPVDVIADYWVFGGSCRGKMRYIEYIRTSAKGMALVRNALWMDMIRRAATLVLFYVLAGAVDIVMLPPSHRIMRLGMGLVILLINLCIILIVLNIIRHFSMWNYYVSAGMIALLLSSWTFMVTVMTEIISGGKVAADWVIRYAGTLTVLAAVVAALMLFTSWQVMHYVRAGYRDAR